MKKMTNTMSLFVLLIIGIFMTGCTTGRPPLETAEAGKAFKEKIHYRQIKPAVKTDVKAGKIEVVELFFYACPHCYTLEPKIQSWLKDNEDIVEFRRIPAILGPTWADQAKAYYAAEMLGKLDIIHPALMQAIHRDKRRFYDEYTVMKFFIEHGVDKQDFINVYTSPEMAEKVNYARIMSVKYGLRGVPAIIINGKYKTAPFYTGSQEKMIEVMDYLIALEKNKAVTK